MLVLIDESGDPGFKIASGSSEYFVVTLLAFTDINHAEAADRRISRLRQELRLADSFEFHFNKLNRRNRETFLRELSAHKFFYLSVVINKRKLVGPGFRHKESFYKYTCSLVFKNARRYLKNATVIIDGSGSREFRKQLSSYLRKRINDQTSARCYIRKIKVEDSKKNNLLQLADVICGAVARSYGKKDDRNVYRDLIIHREVHVQLWPQ
jgi:hypothetical protein